MRDLIDEVGQDLTACGYETVGLGKYNATCSKLFVDSSAKAKLLGFDKGHYFILNFPLISGLLKEHKSLLKAELTYRLQFLLNENKVKRKDKVLCVGIGNPSIEADCFGVKSVQKIEIMPFKKNNRVLKIVPNTFSNTGINAYEIIRLIVEAFDVSAVFLFDSLATANIERLGCSVQFNDAGLTPGSAMNNFGLPINKSTLNVPCFAIGVPMMIDSSGLGAERSLILAEKDVEEKIEFLTDVVSDVFNELFKT